MISPNVPQCVQTRIVRTNGNYDGVDYVIQCANCETWYSVINAIYPLYFLACNGVGKCIEVKNPEEFRMMRCSFVCDTCRSEHHLPVCKNGFQQVTQ